MNNGLFGHASINGKKYHILMSATIRMNKHQLPSYMAAQQQAYSIKFPSEKKTTAKIQETSEDGVGQNYKEKTTLIQSSSLHIAPAYHMAQCQFTHNTAGQWKP